MNQIFRLRDSLVGFLSPAAKRRRTVGPQTPSNEFGSAQHFYMPASEPHDKRSQAFANRRVNKKRLAPSDTKFSAGSRKRAREDVDEEASEAEYEQSDEDIEVEGGDHDDDEYKEEDEEEVENEASIGTDGELGSMDSSSQALPDDQVCETAFRNPGEENVDNELSAEGENKPEMSADAKVKEYLKKQAVLALRKEMVEDVKKAGDWHEDEILLFEKLAMRSFEPLIPAEWKIDFLTWPKILFTHDFNKTFINHHYSNSAKAAKYLQSLVDVASRVRDKREVGSPGEERTLSIAIRQYIKWSESDGGYHNRRFLPVLVVVTARPKQQISSISKEITDQLRFLAKKHRDALALPGPEHVNELGEVKLYSRRPPILYGIIIAQSITIFVTLDSSNPDGKVRTISHFDFKKPRMEVWNALAVAMIVIMARNYMMSIKDELEVDDDPVSDPDA